MIVQVSIVLNRTVGDSDLSFNDLCLCGSRPQCIKLKCDVSGQLMVSTF